MSEDIVLGASWWQRARILGALAAILGVGGLMAAAIVLFTAGMLPFGGPFWLIGMAAIVLGFAAYRRTYPETSDRSIAVVGMITGALVLLIPVSMMLLPLAIVGVPFWYWHAARTGWRWWAAMGSVALAALVIGVIAATMALFMAGTGDPYWNIPRATGIGVELLAFLHLAAVTVITAGFTALFGTRRIGSAAVVSVVTLTSVTLLWWVAVHPQHTGEITYELPAGTLFMIVASMLLSTLIVTRLLRPHTKRESLSQILDQSSPD